MNNPLTTNWDSHKSQICSACEIDLFYAPVINTADESVEENLLNKTQTAEPTNPLASSDFIYEPTIVQSRTYDLRYDRQRIKDDAVTIFSDRKSEASLDKEIDEGLEEANAAFEETGDPMVFAVSRNFIQEDSSERFFNINERTRLFASATLQSINILFPLMLRSTAPYYPDLFFAEDPFLRITISDIETRLLQACTLLFHYPDGELDVPQSFITNQLIIMASHEIAAMNIQMKELGIQHPDLDEAPTSPYDVFNKFKTDYPTDIWAIMPKSLQNDRDRPQNRNFTELHGHAFDPVSDAIFLAELHDMIISGLIRSKRRRGMEEPPDFIKDLLGKIVEAEMSGAQTPQKDPDDDDDNPWGS